MRRIAAIIAVWALAFVGSATPLTHAFAWASSRTSPLEQDAFGAEPDFNGDGFADLAVGVPREIIHPDQAFFGEGGVNVLYGSAGGLSATAVPDQFWSQDSPGVQGEAEDDDQFGAAITSADFNGDGFDDVAIGVPGEILPNDVWGGGVNVIYGSAAGLSATAVPDQFWSQDSPSVQGVAEVGDEFGDALASADFNGDGFDDLAVGVPYEAVAAGVDSDGGVNVIYGSVGGLSATVVPDQFWSQSSSNVDGDPGDWDFLGSSLTAADFNGDALGDLAIGVPGEDFGFQGQISMGVNVIYGADSGLSATVVPDQFWSQDSDNVEGVAEVDDFFGASLAAADFGAGSRADLAIGVPGEDFAAGADSDGGVNVIYGSSGGLSATAAPDQFWSQSSPDVEGAAEDGDLFGAALTAANFGSSSYAGLAIGVPGEDFAAGLSNDGGVNVIYGSSGGLSATTTPDQFWSQSSPGVEEKADTDDEFGFVLARADFNGDGWAELAVGVPREDFATGLSGDGGVNVIYGSSRGLSATTTADQFWSQNSRNVQDAAEDAEEFGWSLAGSSNSSRVYLP